MIRNLTIKNYALINELDISPGSKLNIITGETGAGKSIMLGAIGLLMGNRADTKVLWDEHQKCNVEAEFDIRDYNLNLLFEENDLDFEPICIIRREINPNGKSRAFINDTPVTLDILKEIGQQLLDIHSQHESLQLGSSIYQLNILDQYGQLQENVTQYQQEYHKFITAEKKLAGLIEQKNHANQDLDYKSFILRELEDANLDNLDQESLENELSIQENAEEIKSKIAAIEQLFDSNELSILSQLSDVSTSFRQLSQLSSNDFENLYNRTESCLIELKDIAVEINSKNDKIHFDEEKLNELKVQLDLLYRLQTKHQVKDIKSLIDLRNQLRSSLMVFENLDEAIKEAENIRSQCEKKMTEKGKALSEKRKAIALKLASSIEEIIHQIGIENGTLSIVLTQESPSIHGLDHVSFLFSANKGIAQKDIRDVASGGEFSRLIFAIKYLIADKIALPTIIFDEIDTGVSGEVAIKLVKLMKKMAENHQVIAISHLPQFAAGGNTHFFVYKDHENTKSTTRIKQLLEHERIEAVAKMIGGDRPSTMAVASAKELITTMQ